MVDVSRGYDDSTDNKSSGYSNHSVSGLLLDSEKTTRNGK